MARLRILFIVLSVLLVLCACGAKDDALRLSESLSGDYSFRLNVKSETGELLFGGILSKSDGEYVYVLDYPKESADAKYIKRDANVRLQIGDISIDVSDRDSKISKIFDILDKASALSGTERCERATLYGAEGTKICLDGGEIFFANNKPLLLIWEGARAEITGFTYGKDDNFGNKDQESVA